MTAKRLNEVQSPEVLERAEMDAKFATLRKVAGEHLQALKPFTEELPTERGSLIEQTKFFLAQGAIAYIEVGRRLIILKEGAQYGDFGDVLRELNITKDTSSRAMRVAHKFGNLKSMLHLEPSKLVALLDVPESEIKEIEKSGTVLGMNVDAIDAMTVRQLREKVKERTRTVERLENQIRRGRDQLIERDAEIRNLKIGPKTDLEFMKRCEAVQLDTGFAPGQLRGLMGQVKTETQAAALVGTILYLEKQFALVAEEIQRRFDPNYDGSDGGQAFLDTKPDGINWFVVTAVRFLEEATRKAAEGSESKA